MKLGIALLNTGAPDALRESVENFDRAIAMRRKLPLDENPEFRYGLAAGLINRGDALARLGGAKNIEDAIQSHGEAIALLQTLPLHENPLYLKRLAIAWVNRGIALEAQAAPQREAALFAEAGDCFQNAIALVAPSPHAATAELALVLAVARVNRAGALLRISGDAAAPAARAEAEQALSHLAACDAAELPVAEAGLKARHVLCRALLGQITSAPPEDESLRLDLSGEITDAVEEGLRLVRERPEVPAFRALGTELFQVGTLIYERSQPQFLADFLLDHLDPAHPACVNPVDPAWLAFADESLARAGSLLRASSFEELATDAGRQRLGVFVRMANAREKLKSLS